MKFAVPGHPKSGFLWEQKVIKILAGCGWSSVEGWCGVFVHADGSIYILYVDDFMLVASDKKAREHWTTLGRAVEFSEEAAPILRYLGAMYHLDQQAAGAALTSRRLVVEMENYILNLVRRFEQDWGKQVPKVTSPFPTEQANDAGSFEPGRSQESCASYVATILFAARVCRADCMTAVQRLCTQVSRWTAADDEALIRLMGYLKYNATIAIAGELGPDDVHNLEIRVWTDADWNGDPNTSKSTSGLFIELVAPKSGRTFPLIWKTGLQTSTGTSSAETETVSLATGLRQEGLPIQELLEVLIGRRLWLRCKVDNTQAIAAAKKG